MLRSASLVKVPVLVTVLVTSTASEPRAPIKLLLLSVVPATVKLSPEATVPSLMKLKNVSARPFWPLTLPLLLLLRALALTAVTLPLMRFSLVRVCAAIFSWFPALICPLFVSTPVSRVISSAALNLSLAAKVIVSCTVSTILLPCRVPTNKLSVVILSLVSVCTVPVLLKVAAASVRSSFADKVPELTNVSATFRVSVLSRL